MVLQDLGRRINSAVTNLTREQNLDEKVQPSVVLRRDTPPKLATVSQPAQIACNRGHVADHIV